MSYKPLLGMFLDWSFLR